MPLLHRALDSIRRSLAAELADMRIANERFQTMLARAERAYEQLSDLAACPPPTCSCQTPARDVVV